MKKSLSEIFDEASPRETEELLRGIETESPDELTSARIKKAVLGRVKNSAADKENDKKKGTLIKRLAAAAAVLLAAAGAFAAVKLTKKPAQNITAHGTEPAATAAPSAEPTPYESEPPITPAPTEEPTTAYGLADAVCWVTIGEKLSGTAERSYVKAKVNRTYKGELPEDIVLCQSGEEESELPASDELLVYVKSLEGRENSGYEDVFYVLDKSYAEFTPITPYIPYGRGEGELWTEEGDESEPLGPEDFFVEGDRVFILDSANNMIKIFDGEGFIRGIEVPGGYAYAFAKFGERIYVLDYTLNRIYEIDSETGETLGRVPFPEGIDKLDILQMTSDGEHVWLWDYDYVMHDLFSGETKSLIQIHRAVQGTVWRTEQMKRDRFFINVFIYFLGTDDDGSPYFTVWDPLWDVPVVLGETTLHKYSAEGDLIGIAGLPVEDYVWNGRRSMMLAPDGSIYHIVFEKEGARVYLVKLGTEYESRMDELRERVALLTSGSGDGEVYFRSPIIDDAANGPTDIAVLGDELYVLNSAAKNILRFNSDGELLSSIPFPQSLDDAIRFTVGESSIYVIDRIGKLCVFDRDTGENAVITDLTLKRESLDPLDLTDNGDWFGGDGFAGAVKLMYERDGMLVLVVRESYRLIASYVFDPASGKIERTDGYGFSGTVSIGNQSHVSLYNNETRRGASFDLGDWNFLRVLGVDRDGAIIVEALMDIDSQPVPRTVFRIDADGCIAGRTAAIEDSGFIAFTLSDSGRIYAMTASGEGAEVMLMKTE